MFLFANALLQDAAAIAVVVVGAIVVFWVVRKIVKFIVSLIIAILIAVAVMIYCISAGYISAETADKINPFSSEAVDDAVQGAREWAGNKVKEAAKRAIDKTVDESGTRSSSVTRGKSKQGVRP